MANELETSIVLKLTGNLDQAAARYSRSIDQMAKSSSRSLNVMRGSVHAMGKGLDAMGNRYTALLTGGGLTAATMQVAEFDAQMTRLGTDANMAADQVKRWKQEVQSVANAPDIRINTGDLARALDTVNAKTGDVAFTEKNVRNLGLAIQAFGADAGDVGGMVSQMWKKGIRDAKDVEAFYDLMFMQMSKGALAVADIARISPKILSTTQKMGPQAVAELTGLAQMFVTTTGSADEAATSIQAAMRTFSNPDALKFLNSNGIKVFENDGKTLRPLNMLLREIIERADESEIKLRKIFDDTAMAGVRSLLKKEDRALYDELVNGTVELGRTQRAAAENANTFKSSLQSLRNVMEKFADKKLSGPTKGIADFFNEGTPEQQDQTADDIWNAGLVGGAAILGRKGWNMLPDSVRKKMALGAGLTRNVSLRALPMLGLGAMATAAAQLGAVGYGAYEGTGWMMRMTGADDAFSKSNFGDAYGRGWAKILAALGNADAQSSLDSERNAKLTVAFDMSGAPFVKRTDTNGFDVNVEAGGGTW